MFCTATECKIMFDKMTIVEKPKPVPEIPKVKPLPTPSRERPSVKLVKPKEESSVKPPIEEKPLPSKIDSYKNYNYDYTTPSPASSDLPSEQNYSSSGYSSMGSTPAFNGNYPYSYNRYKLLNLLNFL